MNEILFRALNGLAGLSPTFDWWLIFFAEKLGWVLAASFAIYVLWFFRRPETRTMLLSVTTASLLAWIVGQLIKASYLSERPFVALPDILPLYTYGGLESFPSGHAIVLFAFALTVFIFKRRLGNIYLVGALLVSLARVAVGIHWPSDILAGFIFGGLIASGVYYLLKTQVRL